MYDVQSGQYLKRVQGGVFSYPEPVTVDNLTFLMSNTTTVRVSSTVSIAPISKSLKSEVQPKFWLLADTGSTTSQMRRIVSYQRGIITLAEPFTLEPGVSYPVKIIPIFTEDKVENLNVSFFSVSEYQLSINGVFIPRRGKMTYAITRATTPFLLYSSGDYMISEGTIVNIGTSTEIFSATSGFARIYYYQGDDPAIQGVDAKHKVFPCLEGKVITDFAIMLLATPLVQNNDDFPSSNEVVAIDTVGTVQFKNNQPTKGVYLIIVNM